MQPAGAGDRGFQLRLTPEDLLLDDPQDWLSQEESRFDEQVLAVLPLAQREELLRMMQGLPLVEGVEVDLDALSLKHDAAVWASLSPAQRAELASITRGEPIDGEKLDLDRLEEFVDRRIG